MTSKNVSPNTDVVPDKISQTSPNPNSRKSIEKALLRFLIMQFPHTFFEKERYPLKVGIAEDILKWFQTHSENYPLPNRKCLTSVLGTYTSSPKYMLCLQVDAIRLDLTGQLAGKVTIEEAEHANNKLAILHHLLSARHLKKKLTARAEAAKREEALRQKAEKAAKKAAKTSVAKKKIPPIKPPSTSSAQTGTQPASGKSQPIIRFIRKRIFPPT